MGKLNTHSPIYCMKANWDNWLARNLTVYWWKHQSAARPTLCEGNWSMTGRSPHKGRVIRKTFLCHNIIMRDADRVSKTSAACFALLLLEIHKTFDDVDVALCKRWGSLERKGILMTALHAINGYQEAMMFNYGVDVKDICNFSLVWQHLAFS